MFTSAQCLMVCLRCSALLVSLGLTYGDRYADDDINSGHSMTSQTPEDVTRYPLSAGIGVSQTLPITWTYAPMNSTISLFYPTTAGDLSWKFSEDEDGNRFIERRCNGQIDTWGGWPFGQNESAEVTLQFVLEHDGKEIFVKIGLGGATPRREPWFDCVLSESTLPSDVDISNSVTLTGPPAIVSTTCDTLCGHSECTCNDPVNGCFYKVTNYNDESVTCQQNRPGAQFSSRWGCCTGVAEPLLSLRTVSPGQVVQVPGDTVTLHDLDFVGRSCRSLDLAALCGEVEDLRTRPQIKLRVKEVNMTRGWVSAFYLVTGALIYLSPYLLVAGVSNEFEVTLTADNLQHVYVDPFIGMIRHVNTFLPSLQQGYYITKIGTNRQFTVARMVEAINEGLTGATITVTDIMPPENEPNCTDSPNWVSLSRNCDSYAQSGYCTRYGQPTEAWRLFTLQTELYEVSSSGESVLDACCTCGGGTIGAPPETTPAPPETTPAPPETTPAPPETTPQPTPAPTQPTAAPTQATPVPTPAPLQPTPAPPPGPSPIRVCSDCFSEGEDESQKFGVETELMLQNVDFQRLQDEGLDQTVSIATEEATRETFQTNSEVILFAGSVIARVYAWPTDKSEVAAETLRFQMQARSDTLVQNVQTRLLSVSGLNNARDGNLVVVSQVPPRSVVLQREAGRNREQNAPFPWWWIVIGVVAGGLSIWGLWAVFGKSSKPKRPVGGGNGPNPEGWPPAEDYRPAPEGRDDRARYQYTPRSQSGFDDDDDDFSSRGRGQRHRPTPRM